MPIGRYKIHRGVTAPTAAGALPQIIVDPVDSGLLNIVDAQGQSLLRYDVRPTELAPSASTTLTGKDRVSGKTVVQTRSAGTVTGSDARFNSSPVIEFAAVSPSSDLRIDAPPTASFTGFVVAAIAASLKATPTTAHLMSLTRGSSIFAYLRLLSTGNILFGNSVSPAQSASIQVANVPAADVPFVVAFSYNRATNKVKIYLNGVFVAEGTATTAPIETDSAVKIGIGGVAGQSTGLGWIGPIARLTMFEGELAAGQVATVSAALKTKYAVP